MQATPCKLAKTATSALHTQSELTCDQQVGLTFFELMLLPPTPFVVAGMVAGCSPLYMAVGAAIVRYPVIIY